MIEKIFHNDDYSIKNMTVSFNYWWEITLDYKDGHFGPKGIIVSACATRVSEMMWACHSSKSIKLFLWIIEKFKFKLIVKKNEFDAANQTNGFKVFVC